MVPVSSEPIHGDDLMLDEETKAVLPSPTTTQFLESEVTRILLERNAAQAEVARLQKHNKRMREALIKLGFDADVLDESSD